MRRAAFVVVLAVSAVYLAAAAGSAIARDVYVVNRFSADVAKIDSATLAVTPVTLGLNSATDDMYNIAIKPDGSEAYIAGDIAGSGSVVRLNLATGTVTGTPIPAGVGARGVAITPDGTKAYVTNRDDDDVTVINAQTNTSSGADIPVGDGPEAVAVTPDGKFAIVGNSFGDTISFIDTATDTVVKTLPANPAREFPIDISIKPDGSLAFVADRDGAGGAGAVSVIDLATQDYSGSPLTGFKAEAAQVMPSGDRAYFSAFSEMSVYPLALDTLTFGTAIPTTGNTNQGLAVTPDGSRLFNVNASNHVNVIDTATNTIVGGPILTGAGTDPFGIAIVPNQGPTAGFSVEDGAAAAGKADAAATAGSPTTFSTATSSDPDGTVTNFSWDFGDGETLNTTDATPSHTFADPGTYTVKLTVTDNEGCSTELVYMGQTASCVPSGAATSEQEVVVKDEPFTLKLKAKKKLKVKDKVPFKAIASEKASLVAKGVLKLKKSNVKLGKVKAQLKANKVKKLAFKLSKDAQKALKKAGKGTVQIKATAKTKDGAKAKAKRSIKVRPK